MDRQRNYEVAQVLGRKIEVGTDGLIHIFWKEGAEEVEHVFDDIAPAVRQEQHVLEGWLGIEESVRGQVLVIPGEVDKMDTLVKETMGIAREFLTPRLLTPRKKEELRQKIANLLAQIGTVRNAHKRKFRRELEFAHLQTTGGLVFGEDWRANEQVAAGLYEGAEAGLARLEDIAKKVWGVGIRLQILLREEERVKRIIKSTYISLHRILVKLQADESPSIRELERIASQVFTGKNSLWNGLQSIWIPPYFARVRSREVMRLAKLGDYAATGNVNGMVRVLTNVWLKLRPVIKEEEDHRLPKAKRWIPR